jgi:hypothetical protein
VKDLVLVDPATGEREKCGVIAKKRAIGNIPVWWIVWKDTRLQKIGYVEGRRTVCWDVFAAMTEADLAKRRLS